MNSTGRNPSVPRHGRSHASDHPEPRAASDAPPHRHRKPLQIGDVFNPNGMFHGIWVPDSLLKCSGISISAKLLYGRLARYAGEDGRCFPAVETLARELGMTDRQVQRLTAQLCSAGFLRRDAQYRPNGSQTANAYVFLYHAALAPTPVVESPPRVGGDRNVTGGVTSASPLEESPLNSVLINHSSSGTKSKAPVRAAADPDPDRYPRSWARFRESFPRTTRLVAGRILQAILTACPEGTDEEIAAAVYLERDQHSPGLWAHTLPDRVRKVVERRRTTSAAVPKCPLCGDAGVTWDPQDRASWCSAACRAGEQQRRRNPDFVDAWNAQIGEARSAPVEERSRLPADGGPTKFDSG